MKLTYIQRRNTTRYKEKVAIAIPIRNYNEFNDGMKEKLSPYISKLDKEKDKLRKRLKMSLKKQ